MPKYLWSVEKNRELKANAERAIGFEDIVAAIESGGLVRDYPHPNQERYPNQRIMAVLVNRYVYAVPYVEAGDGAFLKTAFPSRKLTARIKKDRPDE